MTKYGALLFLAGISLVTQAFGAFSIQLDAGQLRANSSTGLSPGSVLIIISAGANGVFDTPTGLTAGNYVAGDDVLLSVILDPNSAGAFNIAGGTNETNNLITITMASAPAGQLLGLEWFPSISYAQWQASVTPTAGTTFGFYNPTFWGNGTGNPDGGQTWTVPSSGSFVSLNFFTNELPGGGSQPPSEGFGNNFVVSAVPEPATYALLGLGGAALLSMRRRKHA